MNVAIIGAGPAGIATSIQFKRYGIEATLFERENPTVKALKNGIESRIEGRADDEAEKLVRKLEKEGHRGHSEYRGS